MALDYETTPGAPCWIELYVSDTERALAFYRELFGWTTESAGDDMGGYITISKDGKGIAGCMHNDGSSGAPDGWFTYLTTPDIEKAAEGAKAGDGQEMVAPMDVMGLGTMAVFIDAGGAAVGAWQPGTHKGFDALGEVGMPYYFELHTRAYGPSVDFYRKAFGWDAKEAPDTDDFRYATLSGSNFPLAGIMDSTSFLPPEAPPAWSIYFRVDDTDAALEKIVQLGGSVVHPADDSPYGRLALAADPTGSQFRIISENR